MTLVDANLLLYAEDNLSEHHQSARYWWDERLSGLHQGKALGNLVSDAHLAALAVEHNCVLFSTDTDFARFPRLRWENPIGGV